MNVRLGINTGFAVNRYPAPRQWVPLIGKTLGLKIVQLTADLLNPSWPEDIIEGQVREIQSLSEQYGVKVRQTFTGAFTRLNHLAYPDAALREYWVKWFCRFADISAALGAESMGSHFGILTTEDYDDPRKRQERFEQNVDGWRRISEHAQGCGLQYLTWEPMSIGREMGETIPETQRIHARVNAVTAIPMKLCLDVDHGDVASPDPDDTDPLAWIRNFGAEAPIIHIKQTSRNKGGHWPFTPEHNQNGRITPGVLIQALEESGAQDVTLLLELSFRERQPFDSRVVDDIRASIDFWRPYVVI
ncbi:MAG: TIM barrel protein [Candidatus Omnitrophica bacterium]|nr:TIM barrel protein [Candidatus Omnitrophota bacterium]